MPRTPYDDVTIPTLDSQRDVTTRLQVASGARQGLGRWARFLMRDLQPMTTNRDVSFLSIDGAGGYMAFTNLGDTTLITIDLSGSILFAAGNGILITLPEGYSFVPRDAKMDNTSFQRFVGTLASGTTAGARQGVAVMSIAKPRQITLFSDISGTAWPLGAVAVYGQFGIENMFQTEHQ